MSVMSKTFSGAVIIPEFILFSEHAKDYLLKILELDLSARGVFGESETLQVDNVETYIHDSHYKSFVYNVRTGGRYTLRRIKSRIDT